VQAHLAVCPAAIAGAAVPGATRAVARLIAPPAIARVESVFLLFVANPFRIMAVSIPWESNAMTL